MSKVTITIELDRYICSELEEVRTMIKTLDFSGLAASVERIQNHANAMESALYDYNDYFHDIRAVIKDLSYKHSDTKNKKTKTQAEKLAEITKILQKKFKDNW